MTILSPEALKPARSKAIHRIRHAVIGAKARKWWRDAVRNAQYGRMTSVLARLPDDVLREIGISRSDIPAYARVLIYGDGT